MPNFTSRKATRANSQNLVKTNNAARARGRTKKNLDEFIFKVFGLTMIKKLLLDFSIEPGMEALKRLESRAQEKQA